MFSNRLTQPVFFAIFLTVSSVYAEGKAWGKDVRRKSPSYYSCALEMGLPFSYHSKAAQEAVKDFELSSSPAQGSYLVAIRPNWKRVFEKFVVEVGSGILTGSMSAVGGRYSGGSMKLQLTSAYLLGYARFGYQFSTRWNGFVGEDSYHPLSEKVQVSSPTGTTSDRPDPSFEIATHATTLGLRFELNEKVDLLGTIYLPAIWYGSFQGRGFNGVSTGAEVAF